MSRIPPLDSDSRPNTNASSDFDAYGTPQGTAAFLPPSPLGQGDPVPMPSALSLAASTPRASGGEYAQFNNYGNEVPTPNNNSAPLLSHEEDRGAYNERYSDTGGYNKEAALAYGAGSHVKKPLYKRPWFWLAGAAAAVIIALAVALPVVFVGRNKNHSGSTSSGASTNNGGGGKDPSTSGGGGGGSGNTKPGAALATWGGDGSTITKDDGSTFTYKNSFGGFWVSDPTNPFNNSAKPNSWTPAIGEKWTWGKDRIHGVNLGGLFVLEPFISPALFQQYPGAQDEWDLSVAVAAAGGNLTDFLSKHYDTFITEEDIAEIAGAGLNWVRLPVPFWAIEAWSNVGNDPTTGSPVAEPFLTKVCWQYILRVFSWCRKYGLRINLDLHTAPGSQNGYNHSGKLGSVNFMKGVMGIANAQRTLDYIRTFAEFISQPEYVDLIPMFSILNEALLDQIGRAPITNFYLQAHNMIRDITGVGEGHGPFIFIHDGFGGVTSWGGFLEGSDRIGIDTHPYFAFDNQPNNEPIDVPAEGSSDPTMMGGPWPKQACGAWGDSMNTTRSNFGVAIAGEYSNAINDCGLFVRGTANGPVYAGDCTTFNDASTWSDNMKKGFMDFQLASMDALGDFFFWTWKIGNDSTANAVRAPLWSYKLGLEGGWMPKDPRQALGTCAKLGVSGPQFAGTFESWQTGGAGAGTIAPSLTSQFGAWPPTSIAGVPGGQVPFIYSYTSSRAALTLPAPTFAPSASVTAKVGSGWANTQNVPQYVTMVDGCTYPDAWSAQDAAVPVSACGATAGAGGAVAQPTATPPAASLTGAVPPVPTSAAATASTTADDPALTARAF